MSPDAVGSVDLEACLRQSEARAKACTEKALLEVIYKWGMVFEFSLGSSCAYIQTGRRAGGAQGRTGGERSECRLFLDGDAEKKRKKAQEKARVTRQVATRHLAPRAHTCSPV